MNSEKQSKCWYTDMFASDGQWVEATGELSTAKTRAMGATLKEKVNLSIKNKDNRKICFIYIFNMSVHIQSNKGQLCKKYKYNEGI